MTTGSIAATTSAININAGTSAIGKWVWRPRWSWWMTITRRCRPAHHRHHHKTDGPSERRRAARQWSFVAPSNFGLKLVTLLLLLASAIENVRALGFFELQILEIENYRGQLATGECCGSGMSLQQQSPYVPAVRYNASSLQCAGAPQCNTLFRVCLREYQSRQQQQPASSPSSSSSSMVAAGNRMGSSDDDTTGTGSNHQPNSNLHHCSFGNVTSPVLGANSFTLGGDTLQTVADTSSTSSDSVNRGAAGGNLALPFSFSWTRSFTFILQAMDYNNYTGGLSVIEEATYSGILLPGNEWKALSHLGHTARMAYRVRVRCDRNYYGQTCTKLCKPRDDRFGHYTCGDTDGRKECIPGWQGENCDKAVCKTGCHPVHGKCDYPGGCECRKGWQGELCDQCMTYPGCKHGYCNGTSWQCICDVNWGGILCDQDLNYCGTHEPCLNGGTCKSTAPDRYTCTCPEGFGGANCDVVLNPCATEPCANGGKCRTVDGGGANGANAGSASGTGSFGSAAQPPLLVPKQFHCDCRPGWTGSTCNSEIDECATQTPRCLNGGTCVDLVADWKCACPDDRWRGRRCEMDVDECERQHRERLSTVIEQQCGPNAVPCKATGTGGNSAAMMECVCRRGWTTTVTRDGNNTSTLIASTLGCTINVDDCVGPDVKCANGGTCLDLIGGYACACPAGYTGRNCRTHIDPCGGDDESGTAGGSNPCKNGGECVPARRWRSGANSSAKSQQQQQSQTYSCICPLGYSGENCEIDRDHCTPNPCRNGGQCLNTPDDYYCQCSGDGWSWHGKNCTVPADDGSSKTVTTSTTTTTTTVAAVTWALPPPVSSSQQPQIRPTTTVAPVAAIRRPGVTGWRHQQQRDDDIDNTSKVTIIVEQQADGGVAMCTSRYRLKHWPAADGCNECKCAKSTDDILDDNKASGAVVSCTNLWCGPASYDCLTGVAPSCTGANQVCVPIVDDTEDEELLDEDMEKRTGFDAVTVDSLTLWRKCLRSPCGGGGGGVDQDRDRDDVRLRYGYDDEDDTDATEDAGADNAYVAVGSWQRHRRPGQCVTTTAADGTQPATTVWPPAVRHCGPNAGGDDHRRGCGRLRVTLDPMRLRRGTRVSAVCHSLRRLLARTWIRDEDVATDAHGPNDGQHRERNRAYVMCETVAANNENDDDDRSRNSKTSNRNGSHRRRRRHVTVLVSVAVTTDEDDDDGEVSRIVGRSVQTLYNRLGGGVVGSTVASTKKVQAASTRLRATSNNSGGDGYDDTAALAFLTAAVVNVVIISGDVIIKDSPSSPAPANSSGFPNDDYRQYYYYWTGGVACGALATVLATAAFLLIRFRGSTRRKVNGEHSVAVSDSSSAAIASVSGGVGSGAGDGLMLSLVRRQNEENLKRLVIGGNCRNSTDYGGGGRNNLSAGSSLSCSRVSIVHPLCNSAAADEDSSPEQQCKYDLGRTDGIDDKSGDKTNVAQPSPASPPVAAVRSIAVAVAVPRQQHQQQQQQQQQLQQQPQVQQRSAQIAANPQPLMLCKKTLNVDNDQKHRRQQQQQQQQQQQLLLLQQQQSMLHYQQQTVTQQYNREHRGDVRDHQQLQQYNNQQQHYAAALTHVTPVNNNNNSIDGDDESAAPSLTVLV